MGNLIIRGYGRDAGDMKAVFSWSVIFGIVGIILVFVLLNAISDNHMIRQWPREYAYGIRIGDFVIPPNPVATIFSLLIAG